MLLTWLMLEQAGVRLASERSLEATAAAPVRTFGTLASSPASHMSCLNLLTISNLLLPVPDYCNPSLTSWAPGCIQKLPAGMSESSDTSPLRAGISAAEGAACPNQWLCIGAARK